MNGTRRWLRLLTTLAVLVACSGRRSSATVKPTLRMGRQTRPAPNGLWQELFPPESTPLEKVLKATLTPVIVPFVLAQLLFEQCLSIVCGAVSGTRRVIRYVFDHAIAPALQGAAELLLSCARLGVKTLSAIHAHILRPLASGVHKYLVVPASKALDMAGALLRDVGELLVNLTLRVLLRALLCMHETLETLNGALEAVLSALDRAFEAVGEAVGKARAALARAIKASASWLVRVARKATRLADWALLNFGVYFAIDLVGKAVSFTARRLHGALLRVGRVLSRVATTLADAASRMVHAVRAVATLTLRALNRYLARPVLTVVRATSQAAGRVITTAGRAVANALSTAGRAVANLLTVFGRAVARAAGATARAAADARRAFIVWWQQPSWLSEVLFKPLLRRAVSTVRMLLQAARWLSWNVLLRPARVLASTSRNSLRLVGRMTRAAGQSALTCLRAVSMAARAAGRTLRRSAVAVASQVSAAGRAVARSLIRIAKAIRAASVAVGAQVLATVRSLRRAVAELAAALSRSAQEIARAIVAAARSLARAIGSAFRN